MDNIISTLPKTTPIMSIGSLSKSELIGIIAGSIIVAIIIILVLCYVFNVINFNYMTKKTDCINTANKIKKMVNGNCSIISCAYGVNINGTACNAAINNILVPAVTCVNTLHKIKKIVNGACITTLSCPYGVNANGTACSVAPAVTCVNTLHKIKKIVNGACVTTLSCPYGVNANGTACSAAPAVACVNTADKIKKIVNGACITTLSCPYGVNANGTACINAINAPPPVGTCTCGKTVSSNIKCIPCSCFASPNYGATGYGACITYYMQFPSPSPAPTTPAAPTAPAAPTTPAVPTTPAAPTDTSSIISPSNSLKNQISLTGYYMWQSNWLAQTDNYSTTTEYFFIGVSAPQTVDAISNLIPGSGSYMYTILPTSNNVNLIVLFTGWSNASTAINALWYNNSNEASLSTAPFNDDLLDINDGVMEMYDSAINYLTKYNTNGEYYIAISFGGGSSTGAWAQGSSGGIYSIYEAVTADGSGFTYTEYSATSETSVDTQTGVGTGALIYGNGSDNKQSFNCIVFDIEDPSGTSSSGIDFINLFDYIKNNPNSNFYNSGVTIIVTISHSCSNAIGSAVCSQIYQGYNGQTYIGVYDYISSQLYTQNLGTTNEYCANSQILWGDFVSDMKVNPMFTTYGISMLLPSINFNTLLTTGGSNADASPNLYYYQSKPNTDPLTVSDGLAAGSIAINYPTDNGAQGFFNVIFSTSGSIGGSIQWVNGTITNISS